MRRSGRLDRVLADELECGRRFARELIRTGRVEVADRKARIAIAVEAGARINVLAPAAEPVPAAQPPDLEPAPVERARVVWGDGELLVINKPAGLHTHAGRSTDSLAELLVREVPQLAAVGGLGVEAGLVHRLDRDTSGVVLAARTPEVYERLRAQFTAHRVTKHYVAVVGGTLTSPLVIDAALARRRTRVVRARRRDRALPARSEVLPLEVHPAWSLVHVATTTGAPHQVRAHLALAGHAILGDQKYRGAPPPAAGPPALAAGAPAAAEATAPAGATAPATRGGQLLHAQRISLPDGRSFAVATPADFLRALWLLRRDARHQG